MEGINPITRTPLETEVVSANKCNKCGKSFETNHGLSMHKARMHKRNGYNKKKVVERKEFDMTALLKLVFPEGIPVVIMNKDFHKRFINLTENAQELHDEARNGLERYTNK